MRVHVSPSNAVVHRAAGAAGLVNAVLIGAVLVWLTPVAQYLPLNALADIVITGVVTVMDFGQLFYLARVGACVCENAQRAW